jgi:hypothetical protein
VLRVLLSNLTTDPGAPGYAFLAENSGGCLISSLVEGAPAWLGDSASGCCMNLYVEQ